MAQVRTFQGREFRVSSRHATKVNAIRAAEALRYRGLLARVALSEAKFAGTLKYTVYKRRP